MIRIESPRSANITASRRLSREKPQDESLLFRRVARVRDDAPQGIAEDRGGLLEGNSVLRQIGRGLLPIPFELECHYPLYAAARIQPATALLPKRACARVLLRWPLSAAYRPDIPQHR